MVQVSMAKAALFDTVIELVPHAPRNVLLEPAVQTLHLHAGRHLTPVHMKIAVHI